MSRSSHTNTSDRPNFIVRAVAHARVSIRVKLLVAFLGITCLMIGLALSGLSALQQANHRTKDLIQDQDRFSLYSEIYGYLGEIQIHALSASIDPDNMIDTTTVSQQASGTRTASRLNNLIGFLGRSVRQVGGSDTPDGEMLVNVRESLKRLQPAAERILTLQAERNLVEVQRLAVQEFTPETRRLQREVYTTMKEIEDEMAATARVTVQDYVASRQQVIGTALAAIGLALLTGYAMSSALIWPVRRIGQALGVIAGGDFNARVRVPNGDELGELAGNVNATSAQLGTLYDEVEGQRAQLADWNADLEAKVTAQVTEIERVNRLRRFLPGQVADLITGTESETEALATRRGEITVLFADLRGFTGFANQATPQQVVAALNAFHSACGPLIEARGGTLERFLGDGLMVLFGAPLPVEDPAGRAVALAQDMQVAVREAMAQFRTGDKPLGLGIGIGSGAATLGQIGFEGRMDYSAIGPAPNLAARLCDKAVDGQILISHATAWQVEVDMEPAGPFDLKGIGPEVAAFELR